MRAWRLGGWVGGKGGCSRQRGHEGRVARRRVQPPAAQVNARAASPTTRGGARRSGWASLLRGAVEFALLFSIALVAKQVLVAVGADSYPNPLWLPVIVLSLQYGLAAGLAAAVIAAGF